MIYQEIGSFNEFQNTKCKIRTVNILNKYLTKFTGRLSVTTW